MTGPFKLYPYRQEIFDALTKGDKIVPRRFIGKTRPIGGFGTMYAEAAYFDGAHVQHIADWQDHQRKLRLKRQAWDAIKRRAGR